MSDAIKHECGIVMIRLRKPLEYYQQKYGSWLYGLEKLYLLMEKQHNRGQEGAGISVVKLNAQPGKEYLFRERKLGSNAIQDIFGRVYNAIETAPDASNLPYAGELLLGHLRYSTTGHSGISYVHPFLRRNNWKSRTLALAGNFNLTNVDEIYAQLIRQGQHPRFYGDTYIMLEQMGHYLDREVQYLYDKLAKEQEHNPSLVINEEMEKRLDIANILRRASQNWDGGYAISGQTGQGDAFTMRDPNGIRPAFYYTDDEIIVVASERPVIQTALNVDIDDVHELQPGEAIITRKDGSFSIDQILPAGERKACSFERIYFSRGSDSDIYLERKKLGQLLARPVLKRINYDIENTVFSFIPNTAEVAYFGMQQGLEQYRFELEQKEPIAIPRLRFEKVVIKDIKLRTFIAQDSSRNELATHVYDITYGSIIPGIDNLVVIDDSIVRGTTLRQSIIKILDRLHPRKIVIVSSSPQIRYPDCYGIDMSRMNEFCAFKAAIKLLQENNMQNVIDEVYRKSKAQLHLPKEEMVNYVKEIYAPFSADQIAAKIAEMLTPESTEAKVEIVFQTLEGLAKACPNHTGNWYFSGDYPTPGGNKVVTLAFINYIDGVTQRSYQS
jgi:amidophosphoribosyltransferase